MRAYGQFQILVRRLTVLGLSVGIIAALVLGLEEFIEGEEVPCAVLGSGLDAHAPPVVRIAAPEGAPAHARRAPRRGPRRGRSGLDAAGGAGVGRWDVERAGGREAAGRSRWPTRAPNFALRAGRSEVRLNFAHPRET